MKKALSLILVLVLCIGLMAGCGGTQKGSVYWLNFKPESDEVLQEIAKMYKEETGVEVKVVTAASGTYNQTLLAEMDKKNAPTLFVIGNQNAVKDWKDYALNLKDTAIAKELNTDAYNLYDEAGNLVSIGYCYECYGIIVNPTLIEKAGFKVEDIKNFETLKTVAESIHSRAKELGFITPFNTFEADEQPSDPLAAEVTRWIARENTTTVPWIFTSFPSENFKTKYGNSLLEYVQGSRVWEDVKRDVVDFWKSER